MRWLVTFVCVLSMLWNTIPEEVKADTVFTNAYMFYNTAGNYMVFTPGTDKKGEIYYATKAKKAVNDGVLYTTLGWQVVVHNSAGYPVDMIYYQMGGNKMVLVNTMDVDGYEYCLYKVSFANIKSRIAKSSVKTLNKANSFISFNACTTTKINGIVQGGMTDSGPSWGSVYTTYEGIANAQNWSEETKQTLLSYYNKTVSGLFYNVNVKKGKGIKSVSGGGSYCYGAPVTINAKVATGYEFSHWKKGKKTYTEQEYSFTMSNAEVTYTAVASPLKLLANFYEDTQNIEVPKETKEFSYGTKNQKLPDYEWKKEGYHQTGWNTSSDKNGEQYETQYEVTNEWILEKRPVIDLYATWDINAYQIVYDNNGGSGKIEHQSAKYTDEIELAVVGMKMENATLAGWSTKAEALVPEYKRGQRIQMSELARKVGVECEHDSEIILYAVWDYAPTIEGGDIYVSLEEAKEGVITEQWLSNYMTATDIEDGNISYGIHKKNSFVLTNYSPNDFMGFQKDGYVTEEFCATDHIGNQTRKLIKVYIVDTTIYDIEKITGTVRFLGRTYYKDNNGFVKEENGGLAENSIWRMDESYTRVLDRLWRY